MSQSSSPAKVVPGPEIKRFRRVVTGHDPQGQSIIASDAASPHVMPIMDQPNFAVTDFWKTFATPADNGLVTANDPCVLPVQVAPPPSGSVFRVVQFPPDKDWAAKAATMGGSVRSSTRPPNPRAKAARFAMPTCTAHAPLTTPSFFQARSGPLWMWVRPNSSQAMCWCSVGQTMRGPTVRMIPA